MIHSSLLKYLHSVVLLIPSCLAAAARLPPWAATACFTAWPMISSRVRSPSRTGAAVSVPRLKVRSFASSSAAQARVVLDVNKSERHIRGGLATREKYQHRLQICSKDKD